MTRTLEPVDAVGENVGLSLSERLGIARAKSGNMKPGAEGPNSTHRLKLSTSTIQASMDITDAEERDVA